MAQARRPPEPHDNRLPQLDSPQPANAYPTPTEGFSRSATFLSYTTVLPACSLALILAYDSLAWSAKVRGGAEGTTPEGAPPVVLTWGPAPALSSPLPSPSSGLGPASGCPATCCSCCCRCCVCHRGPQGAEGRGCRKVMKVWRLTPAAAGPAATRTMWSLARSTPPVCT